MAEIKLQKRAVYIADVYAALVKAGYEDATHFIQGLPGPDVTPVRSGKWIDCDVMNFKTENIPAVDAVEVVRCKDCKHYAMWADGRAMNHCDRKNRTAYDNDFCSYGEAKSGTQPQREDV